MPTAPKDKSAPIGPARVTVAGRDPVSLIVTLGLVGLTVGGILAIFSAPLLALIGR
jgi:hypothetical protein